MTGAAPLAAERLAGFATALELDEVPTEVVAAARLHLLDALGCGLAAHGLDAAGYAGASIDASCRGPASAIGVPNGVPPGVAALSNGIACHALDFDDTHAASVAHVSAIVAPAAIAAAQARGADYGALLAALLAGNEITCRVGMPVGDAFHRRGFHATAVCGVFGATAAVGRLAGLSPEQLVNALGIAGSMASGLLAYLADGSDTKRIHAGWMAHAAHTAACLAAAGATGPAAVLEGYRGVYHAFLGRENVEVPTDDLGVHWETPRIAFKPYPACHFLHAAIDATRQLVVDGGVEAGVDRITVFMPQAGVDMVLSPLEVKRRPRTPYESKFSAPFAIGAQLAHGRLDVTTFTELGLHDEDVLQIASIVDYEARDYPTFPGSFPAGVRIELRDGRQLERHIAHQRGGVEDPMDAPQVIAKFEANARTALGDPAVAELLAAVIDQAPDADLGALQILQDARQMPSAGDSSE